MAKPAVAAGALLTTVANTANTLSNVVNTVNNSVSMLNSYVERQLIKQQDTATIDLEMSRIFLVEDNSREIARRNVELKKELSNPEFKACYDAAHAQLSALFKKD